MLLLVLLEASPEYANGNSSNETAFIKLDSMLDLNASPICGYNPDEINQSNLCKAGKNSYFIKKVNGTGGSLKITLGFGLVELVNIGVQGYKNTNQLGAGIGTLPFYDHSIVALYFHWDYHFGGKSKYAIIPPWYTKALLGYTFEESSFRQWQYVFLSPRVGRNFYFGRKSGLDFELGFAARLWKKEIEKRPSYWNFDFDFPFFPVVAFGFFYLIGK